MPTVCCHSCGEIVEDEPQVAGLMYSPPIQQLILFVHWTCYKRTKPIPCPWCDERLSRYMAGVLCSFGYYCERCDQYFDPEDLLYIYLQLRGAI